MAARRLIIVLLILVGIAIFATALAPVKSQDTQPPATTTHPAVPTTPSGATDTDAPPELALHAGGKNIEELPLEVDRAVSLDVYSKVPDTVEIPGMGLTETVDPDAPAHFDILPDTTGTFAVKLVDTGKLAGKLVVSRPVQQGSARKKRSSRTRRPLNR